MKEKLIVFTLLILSFLVFSTNNAQAGIFDSVTNVTSNYRLVNSVSGAFAVSNMITYGNQVEVAYASTGGIMDFVLTNTSGGWSSSSYTISSDVLTNINNGYSLIQNSTEIHIFYCAGTHIKHYHALKSDHIWSLVEQDWTTAFYGAYCSEGDNSFIFDKNDNKTIYGVWMMGWTWYSYNSAYWFVYGEKNGTSGTWATTSGSYGFCGYNACIFSNGGSQLSITQSSQTNNRFISYTSSDFYGCYTPYLGWAGERKLIEVTTFASSVSGSLNAYCDSFGDGNSYSGILPFKEIDAEYYVNVHASNSFELSYVFDTSDTLGISCTSTYRNNFYACNQTIPYSAPSYAFVGGTSTNMPVREDTNGNLHILYTTDDNFTGHIYQQNGSRNNWYFEKVINITASKSFMDFSLYGNGLIVYEVPSGSNQINFWYQSGASPAPPIPPPLPPPPPIPPATSDNTVLGLVCGAGVFLTGSTMEGGCLFSSLFILAIFLSVIGWIFKYLTLEYKIEIPDQYLVSGLVTLALIFAFIIIGLTDLLTGIISLMTIIAVLVAYMSSRRSEKK
jgi:hypothetical protein